MTGFTLPTSRPVTQNYLAEFDDWDGDGIVDFPGGFYHSIGWDGHNGIDYGCFTGDPVEAVADGVVAFAGNAGNWHAILSGGGGAILVEHPQYAVQTEYLHLSRWLVQAGDTVRRGQVIAHSGATGAATAPHLHLGMLKLYGYNLNDRMRGRIDPTPYLYGNLNPDYAGKGGAVIVPESATITPAKTATDPLEEIMAWYKDRADFEAWQRRIVREEIQKATPGIVAAVWNMNAIDPATKQKGPINSIIRWQGARAEAQQLVNEKAIEALAKANGADPAAITAAVQAALGNLKLSITTEEA